MHHTLGVRINYEVADSERFMTTSRFARCAARIAMLVVFAASAAAAQTQTAATPANSPNPGLIGMLSRRLGITAPQATGGAGTLFSLAKSRLSSAAFSKIAAVVPGMGGLLKAAPANTGSTSGPLGSLGSLASQLPGNVGGLASVFDSFKSLGLSPQIATKMVPLLKQYVQARGGTRLASQLGNALK